MQSLDAKCLAQFSQLQGTSWELASSIIYHILSPFTMNVANQLYHPCIYKTNTKMCEEHITHTELNVHQSNLKMDFLLLSRTFLPVGIAYKTTDNHGFSWYSTFQGKVSNFF